VPASASGAPEKAVPSGALSPATPEEQELATRLRSTVEHLSVEIGERNPGRSWNLASATDDLARTLEKMGYEVRRQGIVMGDDVVQNLEAKAAGGDHGGESVVVAAHFDTVNGSPGADAVTGAAAIVELARFFQEGGPEGKPRRTSRTVRFVLLSNGAAPNLATDHAGSLVYGKDLVTQGATVAGAFCLAGLGAYSTVDKSEHGTPDLLPLLPDKADFIAVVGTDANHDWFDRASVGMKSATLNVTSFVVGKDSPIVHDSDCGAFSLLGFPLVVVTDTGPLRYPHHEKPTDLPKELDFDRMARVVAGLMRTVDAVAKS
jgi:hypothetical protein